MKIEEDLEYHLEDPEEKEALLLEKQATNRKIFIIIIIIFSIILLAVSGFLIWFFVLKKTGKEKEKEKEKDFYLYTNISISENKYIRNSFKKGGENYIEEIGDLNNGKDYEESDRDNFDLCIPYNATKNKTGYKTIMLSIHGGGWAQGSKEDATVKCKNYASIGIMSATMSYTLLGGNYKQFNLYRIIDEISAVLKSLKKFLIEKGYDGSKLELIICGGSAGAHLSLLYSYMIKNPPIPIKFILNAVGPVTINPDDFLTIKPGKEPLENINIETIEKARNDGDLVQMNGTDNNVAMENTVLVNFMNFWLGKDAKSNFEHIFSDLGKREINKTNEIYQEYLRKVKYGYPINYVTKESIPTLCLYGGKDEHIGVAHYSKLKEAFIKNENNNITLIYFRYGTHNVFSDETEYGKKAMIDFGNIFTDYCQKYLNSFKFNK